MIKKSMEIKEYLYQNLDDEKIKEHENKMLSKGYYIREKFCAKNGEDLVISYIKINEKIQNRI